MHVCFGFVLVILLQNGFVAKLNKYPCMRVYECTFYFFLCTNLPGKDDFVLFCKRFVRIGNNFSLYSIQFPIYLVIFAAVKAYDIYILVI